MAVEELREALTREKAQGVTQEQIEKDLRLGAGYLSHLLAGKFPPSLAYALRIRARLGVAVEGWIAADKHGRPIVRRRRRGAKVAARSRDVRAAGRA